MESPVAYHTNGHAPPSNGHANDAGVPSAWLRFLYRMAGLRGGCTYMLVLNVPENSHDEPTWSFMGEGKTENGRRVVK